MNHDEKDLNFNTISNYLTLARIAFVPLVVLLLEIRTYTGDLFATAVFVAAALTDWADGYVARRYGEETIYGKLLDPLADKFIVICTLIMLQQLGRIHPYIVMILVCRELTITGLRALASAEGIIVAASSGGKWKTAIQMTAIPCLMVNHLFGFSVTLLGHVLTYVSLAFSLHSAWDYLVEFFKEMRMMRARKREMKRLKKKKS